MLQAEQETFFFFKPLLKSCSLPRHEVFALVSFFHNNFQYMTCVNEVFPKKISGLTF